MPFLFERRFGIRAFDYWYGYSTCQIELMAMDGPVVDYGGKDKKKGSMMASRSEVESLNELTDEWKKKRNGRSFVGQKVVLNDFLNQKI